MKKEWYNSKRITGFSTVEAMLAVAVFALIATAFTSGLVYGPQGSVDAGKRNQANALIEQGFAAIDNIRSDAWNSMTLQQSGVDTSSGSWALTGEGTAETIGDFTRTITFADVCRTSGNAITACPGTYTDPNTKLATISVSWSSQFGFSRTTQASRYFVNWESSQWNQTDWSGGSGQAELTDATKYDSDDSSVDATTAGQLGLAPYVPCADKTYPFDTASDYTYDSSLIDVTSGKAQLTANGSAPDSNTKGLWHLDEASGNYLDYSGNGNTLVSTGAPTHGVTGVFGSASTFGATTQYASIPDAAQTGLDITGSITVEAWIKKTVMSGSDMILNKWGAAAADQSFQFWVGNLGTVAFQVRNGGSNAMATTAAGAITTGTWYHVAAVYDGVKIKIYVNGVLSGSVAYNKGIANGAAPFIISKTGTAAFNGTIDEVRVSNTARYTTNFSVETHPYGVYYSTAAPTIQPTESYDPTTVSAWLGFQETATLAPNTFLAYQLSSDDGATWQYWNGSAWAVATTARNVNIAAAVNTNIPTFTAATGKILWKAFLISQGSNQVQLDTIVARCEIDQSYPFDATGDYTYDSSLIDVTSGKAQLTANGSAPDSNTKGLWHVDEASGALLDSSGNNNNLIPTGAVTYDTAGEFGTATTFGNSGQYASITDATQTGLDITGSITVEAWIKKTVMSGSDTILDKWGAVAANQSYQFWVGNLGTVAFQLKNGGSTALATSPAGAITVGTWYHVAGVYDGTTIKIYVNGVLTGSTAYSAGIANGAAPFGVSRTSTAAFNGAIDEVRVSNIARYTTNFTVPTHPYGVYYSSAKPTITPAASLVPRSVSTWIGTRESSTLGANTSVQYQLSSDGGATWQYWNGSAWAPATAATNYNTGAIINTNIHTFTTATGEIQFKAFLVSDGSNQVQLDSFMIRYQEAADSGYLSSGVLTSSALDMKTASAVQVVAWNEAMPTCTPASACAIAVELRTAPDKSGSPDTASWTDWYGATGAASTFTNHYGTMVSRDLNGNQWVQYRVTLTGDDVHTPILDDLTINYH